jgi:hypothetical protein
MKRTLRAFAFQASLRGHTRRDWRACVCLKELVCEVCAPLERGSLLLEARCRDVRRRGEVVAAGPVSRIFSIVNALTFRKVPKFDTCLFIFILSEIT